MCRNQHYLDAPFPRNSPEICPRPAFQNEFEVNLCLILQRTCIRHALKHLKPTIQTHPDELTRISHRTLGSIWNGILCDIERRRKLATLKLGMPTCGTSNDKMLLIFCALSLASAMMMTVKVRNPIKD